MKERTRRIDADANRESDGVIVPESPPNKEAPASVEVAEGRTSAKRNAREESAAPDTEPEGGVVRTRRRAKTGQN